MLSDHDIGAELHRYRGLTIRGYDQARIQPASYDVSLDHRLLLLTGNDPDDLRPALDTKLDTGQEFVEVVIDPDDGFTLTAGMFALGSTIERFEMPVYLAGQLQGKSSLGRLGLMVHSTAGYIDPGFRGHVTLELMAAHHRGVVLYPGMPIGQVAFARVDRVQHQYAGKYNDQAGPTASRYHLNWTGLDWR